MSENGQMYASIQNDINTINVKSSIVHQDTNYYETYYHFNKSKNKILLVVDDNNSLVGIIGVKEMTNVDSFQSTAIKMANPKFTFLYNDSDYKEKALSLFYENNFNNIPIIDKNGHVIELLNRSDFYELRATTWALGSGEDLIFAFVLRNMKEIFYIDVGAFDPQFGSVTKCFYDCGSHGINIEPLTKQYHMLVKDRPRDININALCSNIDKNEFDFYINESSSTAVASYASDKNKIKKIKSVTLKNIIEKYLPENQVVHFLKIDVEGFEKEVLEGMDFQCCRPWIVMLESTLPGTDIPTWQNWESIIVSNGYSFAGQYGVNRFYVESSVAELLIPRFLSLDTICKRLLVTEVNTTYRVV
ncbi:FkbM family methyltransferase [Anaerocolumna chitinilytica]|uniref:FkbM family methyltransferase n=1 Tax=Anaerocolumna chitinilytica TaxID=1727145 RepID=A0A7M3S9E2_9FIRM|nr:FkbM family methyltransferase [Anaerocolumna chitinilytica]BCK01210.1 hypothetical protein bsdcttw_42500 [Anaerocolumna chitinilytica]